MQMNTTIELATDRDITQARQLGRAMAREQGFSAIDQARLATAVCELARDFFLYSEIVAVVSLRSLTDGERRGIEIRLQGSGSALDALLIKRRPELPGGAHPVTG